MDTSSEQDYGFGFCTAAWNEFDDNGIMGQWVLILLLFTATWMWEQGSANLFKISKDMMEESVILAIVLVWWLGEFTNRLTGYLWQDENATETAFTTTAQNGVIKFTVDSGATRHVVGEKTGLQGFRQFNASIKIADGNILPVTGIGNMVVWVKNTEGKSVQLTLRDVWYAPDLDRPLFSARWHRRGRKCAVIFDDRL